MNRRSRKVAYFVVPAALISLAIFGCSSKGDGPSYDVDGNLRVGWNQFSAARYDSSKSTFQDVLSHSTGNAEANLGLGWAWAFLKVYAESQKCFRAATTSSQWRVDAQMGLATIYRDIPNFDSAIAYCGRVLDADSSYSFVKRSTINYLDAHLIIAQSYFRKGTPFYDLVRDELDYLWVVKGLPQLPDPGSLSPAEYEDALLERLTTLSALLSQS